MMDESVDIGGGAVEDPMGPPVAPELISDEEALKLVNDTFANYDHGRKPFERQWYRNILFLLGNQWILWDTFENKWRKKRLQDWVPTPVTNKFASSGQRLVSVLSRIEPNWQFIPASDKESDIAAAKKCEQAEGIICEENDIQKIRATLAPWLVYTGNVFLLCGVESVMPPENISPEGDMPHELISDELGPEAADEMLGMMPPQEPIDYKLYTDVLSPFEVYLDQTLENFEDQTKILLVNRRSREYVHGIWGVDVNELDVAPNIHYQESIGYITSSPEITGFLASLSRIKRITVKRLFHKPTAKYPQGLYIVVAGSQVLEKKPLPVDALQKPFVPVVQFKFDNIPGAAFGRTPMDDIVHKQVQRNKVEALIELIAMRMGSPVWIIPDGTVARNFSGQPGAVITYNSIGDRGGKPDRLPGEQIPTSIVQFLANIDKDIEDLVSTFEALKGQAPYSGAPGVVIEQLIEQGLTRFGPSLRNIAEGYRQWMKYQIELLRIYGIGEKTSMSQSETSTWTVNKFRGADIMGAVNVKVESDSIVPRSSQVETAKILEAINAGLIDIQDPNVRQKVLQRLHIQDLKSDIENDNLAAAKENEMMINGQAPMVQPFLDNHVVHLYKHREFGNTDGAEMFRPLVLQHIAMHLQVQMGEMTQAPVPGAMPGQPGQEPQPQAGNITEGQAQGMVPGAKQEAQLPTGIA